MTDKFFIELTSYLEVQAMYRCLVVVAGDFNIHAEITNDHDAVKLGDVLDSFDFMQHVQLQPTHHHGSTLDLVVAKAEHDLDEMSVDPPDITSDHSIISWLLPFDHQPQIIHDHEVRQ